jgi:hypothetical protein
MGEPFDKDQRQRDKSKSESRTGEEGRFTLAHNPSVLSVNSGGKPPFLTCSVFRSIEFLKEAGRQEANTKRLLRRRAFSDSLTKPQQSY